jgi:AraC family transcriptional regulator of adaptative response / DNA-3-methyladenine glycosylase II
MIAFLQARATPGVESVEADCYRRTIACDGVAGSIVVSRATDADALWLDVHGATAPSMPTSVERVQRMFDVAADSIAITGHLASDPLLTRACAVHAGIRVPGAWDPFELSVRAILGQQITVRAATTIAARVGARWGTPVDDRHGLNRLFPNAAQLADARLEEAGIITTRANAIRSLATAVCDRSLLFDSPSTLAALAAIPGIGEWTAQYIAMRALRQADAFLSGDVVLRRMAGGCSRRELDQRAERWRPYRSYAVMLLWQSAVDSRQLRVSVGS